MKKITIFASKRVTRQRYTGDRDLLASIKNHTLSQKCKEPDSKRITPFQPKTGKMNVIKVYPYATPCGELLLGEFEQKLCLCDWQTEKHRTFVDRRLKKTLHADFETGKPAIIEKTMSELDEYFAGKRKTFDIPLLFTGTDFQKRVWNHLLQIPYGETISYGELAKRIGMPKAVRAVANANGANAISILAPCHRVIGSDHSLTGYGGGLQAKKMLLNLERQATGNRLL